MQSSKQNKNKNIHKSKIIKGVPAALKLCQTGETNVLVQLIKLPDHTPTLIFSGEKLIFIFWMVKESSSILAAVYAFFLM